MDRISFNAWKEHLTESGLDGLKYLSTAHHTHPQTTSAEVEENILELSLANLGVAASSSLTGFGCRA